MSFQRQIIGRSITEAATARYAQEALAATSLDELFRRVVDYGILAFRCPIAVVLLRDGDHLHVRASVGIDPGEIRHPTIGLGEGISGKVIKRGQPVAINSVSERYTEVERDKEQYYQGALLSIPLSFDRQMLGVLNLCRPSEPFTRDDLMHAVNYGTNVGHAIASQQLVDVRTRELREREAELKRSEERYRLIADNAVDVIWTANLRGRPEYVSPSVSRLTGYTAEEILASGVSPMLDAAGTAEVKSTLVDIVRRPATGGGENPSELPLRFQITHKSGHPVWTETTLNILFDNSGQAVGILGVTRDITLRVRSERDLNLLHRKLLEASRQAGMAEVATGILHNVGNVLNSLNVSTAWVRERVKALRVATMGKATDLLREHGSDLPKFFAEDARGRRFPDLLGSLTEHFTTEQQAILGELDTASKHLGHIKTIIATQQVHARCAGVLEVVQVDEVVEGALEIYARSLEKDGARIVRDYGPIPTALCDRHKTLQILVNLISNARHALRDVRPPGEPVLTVRTRLVDTEQIRIEVIDNGAGIHPEIFSKIFEHGFTTKKDGNGFGLHSSALAAREMGGALRAASEGAGMGATFILELPYRPAGAP